MQADLTFWTHLDISRALSRRFSRLLIRVLRSSACSRPLFPALSRPLFPALSYRLVPARSQPLLPACSHCLAPARSQHPLPTLRAWRSCSPHSPRSLLADADTAAFGAQLVECVPWTRRVPKSSNMRSEAERARAALELRDALNAFECCRSWNYCELAPDA
eukprot:6209563-Pleurochrysis_carterae.AAC.2